MPRPASHRLVLGSVSALAMTAMLAACSQPASYATVDLSGSYGPSSQTAAQAYSPVTGQPVYQSVSLYGPQSFPDAAEYAPTAQYAAVDAPTDQVASLGNGSGAFDTFGILDQQPAPQYSPVASSPAFEEAELLGSPEFRQEIESVDRAFIDTGPLDAPAPAPFAQPAPLPQAPVEVIETVESIEAYDTVIAPIEPQAPRWETPKAPVIEETELGLLPPPEPSPERDVETVADDYATIGTPQGRSTAPVRDDAALPRTSDRAPYEPWVAPTFGTEPDEEAPAPQRAERPAPAPQWEQPSAPAPAPVTRSAPVTEPSGPDSDFTRAARDLLPEQPQQTRLPAPSAVPQTPPAVQLRGGMRVPKASTAYPRPYELLRPGVWPELENPGEGLVQAPEQTPVPEFAALPEPSQPVAQATERQRGTYEIKRGDTFLTIAQAVGTTPEDLAFENGLTPEAAIYIGQKLTLPARPARVVYQDGIPMIDVAEVAASVEASDIGGPAVPTMDADTANAIMGRAPIQQASIPTRKVTTEVAAARYTWPVHGEVYRLDAGQIEIDATGNAPVAAAAAGEVVHVERGPMGVLVVIEHDNGWRSLTVGLDFSAVHPGDRVSQGATIGKASRDHRVRFELRDAEAGVADALAQLRG